MLEGFGLGIVTGLFQTNFLPFLMQLNFLFPTTTVLPTGEQDAPVFGETTGFGAAPELIGLIAKAMTIVRIAPRSFFTSPLASLKQSYRFLGGAKG